MTTAAKKPVVVYGATGRAGGRIARRLLADGAEVLVAGQNPGKIARLAEELGCSGRTASVSDAGALRTLVDGACLVVNCAGPFVLTARPLAEACVAANVDYLDISGESVSVRSLTGLHAAACHKGVSLVPAAGAKGALGSWALSLATGSGATTIRKFLLAYAHGNEAYWRPTVAALLSVAREGMEFEARRPLNHGRPPRRFEFPPPFGIGLAVHVSGTDDVALPDEGEPREVRSYLSVEPGTAANLAWGFFHHPIFAGILRPSAPLLWGSFLAAPPAQLAALLPEPRDPGRLAVVVEPDESSSSDSAIAISTSDGYGATSSIVALCARRLLSKATVPVGVVSPTRLLPARDALRRLARAGEIRIFRDGRIR